jgi:hypothetical protein
VTDIDTRRISVNDDERQSAAGVTCCIPLQAHSPSGLKWVHRRSCPTGRGQVIRSVFTQASAELRRVGKQKAETASKGVVVPLVRKRPSAIHPACRAAMIDGGATPCSVCSWRLGLDNEGAREVQARIDGEGY